ncbi:MAG: tetratricopeptide repeat protein, partial [Chloroflexota bacterium]
MTRPKSPSPEQEKRLSEANAKIGRNPGDWQAFLVRAVIHKQLERYPEALADCSAALELQPGNAHILVDRAAIYRLMNENRLALDDLTEAINGDPNLGQAYYQRARCMDEMGQPERA